MTGDLAPHAEAAVADALTTDGVRHAPGCVVAITHRGRLVAATAQGEARRGGAVHVDTVFRIASMSKSFLAATVLALRDDGALDLHVPAAEYLPALGSLRRGGVSPTLDDLLSNKAGLGEDNPWGDEHLGSPRAEMAAVVARGLRTSVTPRTRYQYSNVGISLLGRAVEAVTSRTVEEVTYERILAPLGLHDTRDCAERYAADEPAAGYRTFDDGATFVPEPFVGSGALGCIGGWFSTAADIARWMDFLGSAFDEAPHADAVLTASSRREMQTARTLIPAGADRDLDGMGYGYGLVVEHDRRFGRIVQHAGGLPGFSSHMRWHPTTGVGAVVFGNSDAFPAGRVAMRALSGMLTRLDAPAELVRPWPETLAAARLLDDIIAGRRPLTEAGSLLARNVLRDVPAPVRERRLQSAWDEVGGPATALPPLEERILSAPDESTLRWAITGSRGTLICDVQMVGLREPLVQSLSVEVAAPDGRVPRGGAETVYDHHRVLLG